MEGIEAKIKNTIERINKKESVEPQVRIVNQSFRPPLLRRQTSPSILTDKVDELDEHYNGKVTVKPVTPGNSKSKYSRVSPAPASAPASAQTAVNNPRTSSSIFKNSRVVPGISGIPGGSRIRKQKTRRQRVAKRTTRNRIRKITK